MNKIINGKKYDTETAEMLLSAGNGYLANDFRFCNEELYRKKTGELFLFGEGGPLTEYARPIQNGKAGSWRIIPLSEEEAKEWVAEHFDANHYIRIFGDVEE